MQEKELQGRVVSQFNASWYECVKDNSESTSRYEAICREISGAAFERPLYQSFRGGVQALPKTNGILPAPSRERAGPK